MDCLAGLLVGPSDPSLGSELGGLAADPPGFFVTAREDFADSPLFSSIPLDGDVARLLGVGRFFSAMITYRSASVPKVPAHPRASQGWTGPSTPRAPSLSRSK